MTPTAATDRLVVWFENRRVGELWRDRQDRMGFQYDDDWLEAGFAIGHVLPLQSQRFDPDEGSAHAWFANLLPEGGARERLVRNLGVSDDDFALLREIGGDCAGALSLMVGEQAPDEHQHAQPLADGALDRMLAQRGQGILPLFDPSSAARPRLSLAGAQSKCPVLIENGRFLLPLGATASTHILKFELPQWRHAPVYELFLARLAAAVGLPVPGVEMYQRANHRFLVVTRYDRAWTRGRWRRLHQEDFCQVAGLRPTRKYEAEGGPGLAAIAAWIRELSARPAEDLLALIRWQAFNYLAGNSDGHAKNLSLVRDPDLGWRLAPFYDLVCTRAWPDLDRRLAMAVGGEADPGRINRRHWEQTARDLGMRPRFVVEEVRRLTDSIEQSLPEIR
ncbi:MAG: type II toxin-antitoxin system HipA family toxin, partial [Wenzhouxiangella sp.]|nr:type II toxin-antitoxin system HipA family toxin [Wenzhouxiangella sp.]